MSPRLNRSIMLVVATALLGIGAGATAQEHVQQRRGSQEQIIDLTFPGGTASDYVEAVRKAAGDANVMMSPYMKDVPVQPVELKRVSVHAALGLLDGRYTTGGRTVEVVLDVIGARSPESLNVYKLQSQVRSEQVEQDTESGVWSLNEVIEDGHAPETVLTAIETALDLYDDAYGPAELRFHRESGLLIARAHSEQIDTITKLLSRVTKRKVHDAVALEEARARIADLEIDLASRTTEIDQLHRQLMEIATRAEMLEREVEELRNHRRDLGRQLTATQIDRDTRVGVLELEIHRLRETIDGGRKP